MDFKNMTQTESIIYLDEAVSVLTEKKGYIVNKIIKDENNKWIINPEVKQLAEQIYNMDYFVFDKRYNYPLAAGNLLRNYDIEYSENGVEILCSNNDKQKIKKAILQLLHPASGFDFNNLKENLKAVENYNQKTD